MTHRLLPGVVTLAILALVVGGAFYGMIRSAGDFGWPNFFGQPYTRTVVIFSLGQAFLSTLLSVAPAIWVARALARRQAFPGRELLLRLFGLPLVMPSLVAILGIVAIYGQSGVINRLAVWAGFPPGQYLYGLSGILIAHVFFNLPLATRLLLPVWQAIPGETWRIATQLGMGSRELFRLIEWPLLRQVLPGIAGLVFMLCFTSFAVVLTLGGGPARSTIEVAIYQAVRFEFDLDKAVMLALTQVAICAVLTGVGQLFGRHAPLPPTAQRPQDRPDLGRWGSQVFDATILAVAALFVLLPLLAVLWNGTSGQVADVLLDQFLWRSVGLSMIVAIVAGTFALGLGLGLLQLTRELRLRRDQRRAASAIEIMASLVLVVPPLVIGTGIFVLLAPIANVFAMGLLFVILVNAIIALPYVIRTLGPPMMRLAEQHDRLCASLGVAGLDRLRLVEWPLLRRPIGTSLALASALAVGDLGVVALFGTQGSTTLPLLLYQRIAAYQLDAAASTALVLLALCLGLFLLFERVVGGHGEH